MLMCKKECAYSENGYCLLSAEEHLSGVADGCTNFRQTKSNFRGLKNKVNGFSDGADVNKLNGTWNTGAH